MGTKVIGQTKQSILEIAQSNPITIDFKIFLCLSDLGIDSEKIYAIKNDVVTKIAESNSPKNTEKIISYIFESKDSLLNIMTINEFAELIDVYMSHITITEMFPMHWEMMVFYWKRYFKSYREIKFFMDKNKKQENAITPITFANMSLDIFTMNTLRKDFI